jgi:hypothetical protein
VSWWRKCFATISAINIRGRVKKQGLIIIKVQSALQEQALLDYETAVNNEVYPVSPGRSPLLLSIY